MEVKQIKTNMIVPDENQPRKYFDEEAINMLTTSIKENGIEIPITVYPENDYFVIIDGERRFRASINAGIESIPCIIAKQENVLEKQLRTDCLKESLSVDELDEAIYKYYEHFGTMCTDFKTSFEICTENYICTEISKRIGKSIPRVQKAIDRFEFKRDNQEFTERIEKKYNPENKKYGKVNSTIAMTSKLKDNPEVRKALIENVLNEKLTTKSDLSNKKIKERIDIIKEKNITEPEDAIFIMKAEKVKDEADFTKDPRFIFKEQFHAFNAFADEFYSYDFESVKDHIQGDVLNELLENAKQLFEYIKNIKEA